MDTLSNVLFASDLTEGARTPLAQAAFAARASRGKLHVLRVLESLWHSEALRGTAIAENEVQARLMTETQELLDAMLPADQRPEDVQVDVRIGAPLQSVLDKVRETAADLLVLSSECGPDAGGRLQKLAQKAVQRVPTRVVVVRGSHSDRFRHIMACVDLSESSWLALHEGVRFAKQHGARLTVAHVFKGPWRTMHYRSPTPEASPEYKDKYQERLRLKLAEFVAPLASSSGVDIQRELIDAADEVEGIREYIQRHAVDLAILATRPRRLRSLLFRSTTEHVLRECGASVMAVKPSDAESVPELAGAPVGDARAE